MSKKTALILSFSHLGVDPRIKRQIIALKKNIFLISASGFSCTNDESISFYQIYQQLPFSIIRKIKRLFEFLCHNFDKYYWDDNKKRVADNYKDNLYDIIIANDIYTLPLALKIANKHAKVYFDAHEYHPEEFNDKFIWRIMNKSFILFLCNRYIPLADAFTTVSESISLQYEKLFKIKPIVITNAKSYTDLFPSDIDANNIKLVHHGMAIPSRKIELMIEMLNYTDKRFNLTFILVDTNSNYLSKLKKLSRGNKNIRFVEPVNPNEICTFTNSFDIGVFLLPPVNFNQVYALPNKFFEFIQARLGIVISPNMEMANIVNEYGLGIVSKDYTPKSMAKAINSLTIEQIKQFKNNSHKAAVIFNAEKNIEKLNEILTTLVKN